MTKKTWVWVPLLGLSSCRLVLGIDGATESALFTEGMGGSTAEGPSAGNGSSHLGDDQVSMGGAPGGLAPRTPCERYCEDMDQYCSGADAQYVSKDQCLKTCELYEMGEVGENGNTQSCRVKYASRGKYTGGLERSVSCRHAGPAGYGVCGSMCEGYCTVMMNVCTKDVTALYYFETFESCMSDCAALPAPEGVLYNVQNPDVFDGGHLQCRLFHVMSALMVDPEEHCEHALGVTLCELGE
jgi:hypothetical protein